MLRQVWRARQGRHPLRPLTTLLPARQAGQASFPAASTSTLSPSRSQRKSTTTGGSNRTYSLPINTLCHSLAQSEDQAVQALLGLLKSVLPLLSLESMELCHPPDGSPSAVLSLTPRPRKSEQFRSSPARLFSSPHLEQKREAGSLCLVPQCLSTLPEGWAAGFTALPTCQTCIPAGRRSPSSILTLSLLTLDTLPSASPCRFMACSPADS